MKCTKCAYFYRSMVGKNGAGYNPAPFCHCYEDTGQWPNVLTQECFVPHRKPKIKKSVLWVDTVFQGLPEERDKKAVSSDSR